MTERPIRRSILIPLLLVAFGVVVLLVNFGVLDGPEVWRIVLRGWPLLIVLLGVDLLVTRASAGHALGVLVLACVVIGGALCALHFSAPLRWTSEVVRIREPLPSAATIRVDASCPDCSITLGGGASRNWLVEGSAEVRWIDRLVRTSETQGTEYRLELRGEHRLPFSLRSLRGRPVWSLRVADDAPMTASVSGARCDVDLGEVSIDTLFLRAEGDASIRLSEVRSGTVYVAAHSARIEVPAGVGLVVEGVDAVADLVTPDGYSRSATSVSSPRAEAASVQTRVVILPGAERVEVVPVELDSGGSPA